MFVLKLSTLRPREVKWFPQGCTDSDSPPDWAAVSPRCAVFSVGACPGCPQPVPLGDA